jgi:hypothetical protein
MKKGKSLELIDNYFLLRNAKKVLKQSVRGYEEIKLGVNLSLFFISNGLTTGILSHFIDYNEYFIKLSVFLGYLGFVFILNYIFGYILFGNKIVLDYKKYFTENIKGKNNFNKICELLDRENLPFENKDYFIKLLSNRIASIEKEFMNKEYFDSLRKEINNYNGDKIFYIDFLDDLLVTYNKVKKKDLDKIDSVNKKLQAINVSPIEGVDALKIREDFQYE